jgi:hypothetical protein
MTSLPPQNDTWLAYQVRYNGVFWKTGMRTQSASILTPTLRQTSTLDWTNALCDNSEDRGFPWTVWIEISAIGSATS